MAGRPPAGGKQLEQLAMTSHSSSPSRSASSPRKLSPLDIVIARHAWNHGSHESPLVGCYLCLTGAPRTVRTVSELRAAA